MGDLGAAHGAGGHVGWHVEALRSHAQAALPLTQMITEHLPLTLRKHLSVNGPLGNGEKNNMSLGSAVCRSLICHSVSTDLIRNIGS